ncbi:unnamed protein product [Linum trigynum]|uniref:Uncharacterized protein n=1 Tax=Linum trigynum TaxID=586398 RepID=A0AAV2GBT9_9ROSI
MTSVWGKTNSPRRAPVVRMNKNVALTTLVTFSLLKRKFEDQVTSVEEQDNPLYDLAWHLSHQTVLEDMNGKEKEVSVEEEEESIKENEDLDCSQGEESNFEEGREVEVEDARMSKKRTRSRWMKLLQVTSAIKAFHPTLMRYSRRTCLRLFAKPKQNHRRSLLVDAMEVDRGCTTWYGANRREKNKRRRGLVGGAS